MILIKAYRYIKHVLLFSVKGLIWSISPYGKDIKKLRLKNRGKRCFIIATGPSLNAEDLEKLQNEDTIAVNSIFLMYEKTTWRPTYYVCTDAPYFSKLIDAYNLKTEDICNRELFLNADTRRLNPSVKNGKNILWIPFSPWNRIYDFENYRFQDKIDKGMYAFGTVTNIAIAIAMYLGYSKIYLLGVDCSNFNKHFVNDVTDKDKDAEYLNVVMNAQLHGYEKMKIETQKRNVAVYNATRGGALEVFERVDFDVVTKMK